MPKGSASANASPTSAQGGSASTAPTTSGSSSGLGLEGIRVNTTDSNGQVHFNALRFSDAGLYDLKFTLGRGPRAPPLPASSAPFSEDDRSRSGSSFGSKAGSGIGSVNPTGVAVVRVTVAPHEDDSLGPLGRCGQALYALLQSVPQQQSSPSEVASQDGRVAPTNSKGYPDGFGGGTGSTLSTDEALAWLPAPLALWAPLPNLEAPFSAGNNNSSSSSGRSDSSGTLSSSSSSIEEKDIFGGSSSSSSCGALLSAAGFRATAGWSGGVWLLYRPAAVALDTGIGLPNAQMSPLERLGLAPSASSSSSSSKFMQPPSERAVRRAYYQASLLWHPDRWASYPGAFLRRAMDCFELISDAYRVLSEPQGDEDRTSDDGRKGSGSGSSGSGHADASAPIVLGM